MTISLAPLDELAAQLRDVDGIRSASTDPADVITPGVFIACGPITIETLGEGYSIQANLRLVVSNNGVKRSRDALIELLNLVLEVVDPDGPITPQALQLPGNPSSLPGLIVPVVIETGA